MFVVGDCTVTNGRYTSVIHRYCEGKQTCTSFQVDRRFCGANQTTYEQVEYECVPGITAKTQRNLVDQQSMWEFLTEYFTLHSQFQRT